MVGAATTGSELSLSADTLAQDAAASMIYTEVASF
jgi:hypothetical protein